MADDTAEWDPLKYYIKAEKDGSLRRIDVLTGECVILRRNSETNKYSEFIEMEREDGSLVLVDPRGEYTESGLRRKYGKFVFSWELAEEICERVVMGTPLSRLTRHGLPSYGLISKWRRLYPVFDEMITSARVDRAEEYIARAEEAVELSDKDNVQVDKLRVDFYKHLAKVSNPDGYGDKTTVRGDGGGPLHVVLDTGIRRDSEEIEEYDAIEAPMEELLSEGVEYGEAGAEVSVSGIDVDDGGDATAVGDE